MHKHLGVSVMAHMANRGISLSDDGSARHS
jgi:hypothetical protein